VKIELLKDSNGVVVKMGDISNPTALEIEFCYPRWAEKNELLFEQLNRLLSELFRTKRLDRKFPDYSR